MSEEISCVILCCGFVDLWNRIQIRRDVLAFFRLEWKQEKGKKIKSSLKPFILTSARIQENVIDGVDVSTPSNLLLGKKRMHCFQESESTFKNRRSQALKSNDKVFLSYCVSWNTSGRHPKVLKLDRKDFLSWNFFKYGPLCINYFIFLGTLLDYNSWILQFQMMIGNRKEDGRVWTTLLHVTRKSPTPRGNWFFCSTSLPLASTRWVWST